MDFMSETIKKPMMKMKRKIAAFLVVVLTVQSLLTAGNVTALAEVPDAAKPESNIFELEGSPKDAFEYIYVQLGETVCGDGEELSLTFWYSLINEWIEEQYESYLTAGLLDPYSFEYDSRYTDIRQTYGTYESYLMEQTDIPITAPSFTCRFNDGFADIEALKEMIEANSQIFTDAGKAIGEITVRDENGPVFYIEFYNNIFVRQNIYGNKGMEMKLLNQYEEGTEVDVQPGSGDNSLDVAIKGDGTPIATDSNYYIEKEFEQGINMDNEYDPSAINYRIIAKATPSNLASDSIASMSTASVALVRMASSAVAEAGDSSEDEDDIPDDAKDGELINDLFKVPTRSTIVRGSLNNGEESEYEDLTGKYITDAISSNLVLDAVYVSYDGISWTELLPDGGYGSWEEYLDDHGRIFTYEIAGETDEPVWQCEVMLYTRIADQLWRKYAQTGTLDYTFPNRAVLKANETSGTLAVSNKVEPEIHWEQLLSKEGQIIDINSNKVRWNIEADAHFSGGVQLYLVDHIEDIKNTHNYIWDADNEGTITIEGGDQTVTRLELDDETMQLLADELEIDVADIWTELGYGTKKENDSLYGTPTISTIEKLFAVLEAQGILTEGEAYNSGYHYAYEYTYQNEDNETVTDAIMLISMKDYINGTSIITYDTVVTAKVDDATGAYGNVELANDLRPVWKWAGGRGPGEVPTGYINARKDWKIRTNVVNKTAGDYNDVENTVAWLFDVNQTGKELQHVWIEDPLDPSVMRWTGAVAAEGTIELVPYERSPAADKDGKPLDEPVPDGQVREIKYLTPEEYEAAKQSGSAEDYYTVDGTTLKVHLGPVAADEYYKFQVQTAVINPQYANGEYLAVTNTAEATVEIEGHESTTVDLEAIAVIEHELIEKEAIESTPGSSYNYDDNTVKWRVLLNPKQFTITGAKITDTLPDGTIFDQVTNILVDGKVVDQAYDQANRIKIQDSDIYIHLEEQDGILVFCFVDETGSPREISQTYVIEYTTKVTEDFRKNNIKSNGVVTTLVNKVKLDGQIEGVDIRNAEDDAKHKIQPQSLWKEGTYHSLGRYTYYYYDSDTSDTRNARDVNAVYFNWTAYINRLGENMTDAVVSDTLANCFEMVPATFCVEAVELDAEGKETTSVVKIVEYNRPCSGATPLEALKVNESGFSFTIPEAYKNAALKITFDTVLVDDASAAEMKNAVNVRGDGWSDSSTEATDKHARDFHYTDYSNADGMYFLRVVKRSSNNKLENLYLEGAGFSLSKMKLKSGGNAANIDDWEAAGWNRERVTNVHGVLNFLFLEPNTLYRLAETKAPDGYDQLDKVWYVAILDQDYGVPGAADLSNYPAGGDAADGSYEVILVNPADIIDPVHFKNMIIDNEPRNVEHNNELVFKKVGQNGQILPGVIFQLTWENSYLATVSDAQGMVTFEKLDPSKKSYTLREVSTLTGYQKATNWRAEVRLGGDGKYIIELQESQGGSWAEVSRDNNGTYILQNKPITNTGSFEKVDQNGDRITAFDVTFHVERLGHGGFVDENGKVTIDLSKNTGEYETCLQQETVSSAKGIVELKDFYYGYYRLTENWNQDKLAEKAKALVYIRVDQSGVWAAEYGTVPTKDADYKYNLSDTGSVFKVNNVVMWGLVDVNKVVGTYNTGTGNNEPDLNDGGKTSPVAGALFAIYKDGDSTPWFYVKTVKAAAGSYANLERKGNAYMVYDQNGKAAGETKVLPVGNYYLKEISIVNYVVDSTLYPFEIEAGTFAGEGDNLIYEPAATKYVATKVTDASGVTTSVELDGMTYFLDMPIRYPVNLDKVDEDHTNLKLTDAEFSVYAGKNLVAWIRYDDAKGKYVLVVPEESYTARDSSGRKYLELKKNTKGEYEYALLAGSYNVTETKAPAETFDDTWHAYPATDKTATLVVNSTQAYISTGALRFNNTTLKNQLKRGEFTLSKDVLWLQKPISDTGKYAYNPVEGFTFTLTGTTLSGKAITKSDKTDSQGKLTFKDIPLGTYKLSETGVPGSYIANSETGELIVKEVPDIWVKIEAADNDSDKTTVMFYQNEDCTAALADSESADKASQSDSTIGKNAEGFLLAYNALKTADVAGVKVSHFGLDADGTSMIAALSDAEFTLAHQTLKYADGTPYTFTCKTDSDGNIRFTNVPYGRYKLTEVKTPDGYLTISPISFTISEAAEKDGTLIQNENGTYTYYLQQDGHDIYDEVALTDVKLRKVNQNGDAISWDALNAKFVVERISKSLTGYPLKEGGKRTCQIDNSGILLLDNLASGVYKVTEDLSALPEGQQGLVSGSVQFWIEVETEVDASHAVKSVKVSVYNENPTTASGAKPVAVISGINQEGTADFTNTKFAVEMNKLMKNTWAYGAVDINKVRGEWKSDGKYEATAALAGVKFVIYEADATGKLPEDADTPYLILMTDVGGHFPGPETDGIYSGVEGTGNKALLAGNYVIKELSLGSSTKDDAYDILSEYIPFAVTAQTTTWIYTDNDSEGNLKATASDSAAAALFFNVPKRGTLSFDKVDADNNNKYLKDAEFALYLMDGAGNAGEKIGTIGYDDSAGVNTYHLIKPVNTSRTNANGIPYIVEDEPGNYHLLAGEYIVRETKAPAGYQLATEEIPVTIAANTDTQVNGGTITNIIQKASITLTKQVEDNPSQIADGTGTAFVLRGNPANEIAVWAEYAFVTDTDGSFTIKDIPLGEYALYEQATASDSADANPYQGFGEAKEAKILDIVITMENGQVKVTLTPVNTAEEGVNTKGITVVTDISELTAAITNNWKRGSITGRKVAADNPETGLSGAIFGLYTDAACSTQLMTAASQADGAFVFEELCYGTYYVKEIQAPSGYVPSTVVYQVNVNTQKGSVAWGGKLDAEENAGNLEAIIFTNSNKRGEVELTKKATPSDVFIKGSAEFTIYADSASSKAVAYLLDSDSDGTYTLHTGSNLETSVNGVRYLQADDSGKLLLIQGFYWVKETKVPAGYQTEMDGGSQKVYPFKLYSEDDVTDQLLSTYIISNDDEGEYFCNELATGGFTLEKTIEVSETTDLTTADTADAGAGFWFEIAGTDRAAASGKKIAETETLRIDDMTLAEAVAAGIAEEMTDGSIRVVTGTDGVVAVSGLPIGTYLVTEKDGPDYNLYTGTDSKTVVLKQNDDQTEIVASFDGTTVDQENENLIFHNALKRYDLTGKKVDDAAAALAGAVFGLYSADGTTKYREATSGADGWFTFDQLPTGEYMVKEVRPSSESYLLNTQEYNITITAEQSTSISVLLSPEAVVNVLKRGSIKGLKVNTGGLGLTGATLGLFPAGTTEFTEANLFEGKTAVSDTNGYFEFVNIPYGTYRVAELIAPGGYRLNTTTSYLVSVTENGGEVTTGYQETKLVAEVVESDIRIVNSKTSGGGGSGGSGGSSGSSSTSPGGPGSATTIEESGVPLGGMTTTIEENATPLGTPLDLAKMGDTALPYALLAVIMLGALGGIGILVYRRKKEKEE